MKGKAALMGATIAMMSAVVMVVLVLLAELYCTLLLHKHRHPNTTTSAATSGRRHLGSPSSLCSFYAQGVIRPPRSFLFPEAPPPENQLFHNNLCYSSTASAIYICNPIYVDEAIIATPFETPAASSPSNLDMETGSSAASTPPLTPMKKLQAEGASVSLRDGGSICTTASDSNTFFGGASSSSGSASPSW